MIRRLSLAIAGLILMLPPLVARAEVSVQVDRQGRVRKLHYLTGTSRRGAVIWGQVRPRVPLEAMLNPLGDTYGDLAPAIATDPLTGNPWVIWPRNEGNQKRLVASAWNGRRWTAPVYVATPDPMGYDQLDPRLLFDASGVPYLVYAEAAPNGRVLFSTLLRGAWTPPMLLSRPGEDSRGPTAELRGADLLLGYSTPSGSVSRTLEASRLVDGAVSLMDSPIPPGSQSGPGDSDLPGAPQGGRGGPRDDDDILQAE